MSLDWPQFFTTHASAVFALVGAIAGGILSFVAGLLLKQRDYTLELRSRLIERQILAHETILTLAAEMRVMCFAGGLGSSGEVRRSPRILRSKNEFESWFTKFSETQLHITSWLSTSAKREISLIQDYFVTLHMYLTEVSESSYFALGEEIHQDFIDLSSSLEKKTFDFFRYGIGRSKPDSLDKWHKYEKAETLRRLKGMKLLDAVGKFKKEKSHDAG